MQRPLVIYIVEGNDPIDPAALAQADMAIRVDGGQEDRSRTTAWTGKPIKNRDGEEGRVVQIVRNL